jgi:hypothetical protein
MLASERMIVDSIDDNPLLLVLEKDSASFHAFSRMYMNEILNFNLDADTLIDMNSTSKWNMQGECFDGKYKGAKLTKVAAYQEFLHSWEYFHPNALRYKN